MAHFAKIGLDNTVLEVVRLDNKDCMTPEGIEQENIGVALLERMTGHASWVQCSFNTYEGEHLSGGVPLRKNFPDTSFIYDTERDAFIQRNKPNAFTSWIFDEEKCVWVLPEEYPADGLRYKWNDVAGTWEEMSEDEYYI